MTIHLNCSSCGKTLMVNDAAAGQRAKCPVCGALTQIPDAPGPEPEEVYDAEETPFAGRGDGDRLQEGSDDQPNSDRTPCPMCGEMIMENAAKCRYCGEIFDDDLKKHTKTVSDVDADMTTGDWLLAILCSGIGCIIGVIWMIQGKPKGAKMFGVSIGFSLLWSVIRAFLEMAANQ